MKKGSSEERLLKALFDGLTEEEGKYLKLLLGRIDGKSGMTTERARELFKKRFPNSKWLLERQ